MAYDSEVDDIKGEASHRNLYFFWLIDWSYSMEKGGKIQKVNYAIKEVIPELRRIEEIEKVKIFIRAIRFGHNAEWYVGPEPIPVADFEWEDINSLNGTTATSEAINLLTDALHVDKIGNRNVPPVCILLSDGYCTDPEGHYQSAIDKLNKEPWGNKAVRLSIGIAANDGDYNKEELDEFISPYLRKEDNIETLHADTPRKLVEFIRLASTVAAKSSSNSKESAGPESGLSPVNIDKDQLRVSDDEPDYSSVSAWEEY